MSKPLKTPAGSPLDAPTPALAAAIAEEQHGKIRPLTQLACTAIDIMRKDRAGALSRLTAYAESELLCHRAQNDPALAVLQKESWQPLLDWCAERFGARLNTGPGIMPIAQPPESLNALRAAVEDYDDFRLTGLLEAASVTGSLVLALALAHKHIAARAAFAVAELEAVYQAARWGEDPAAQKRHDGILRDLEICERWFGLL